MGFESNSISIPFHWSGGILAITIVVSIILVGTGFYIASLNWPTDAVVEVFIDNCFLYCYYCRCRLYADTLKSG